MSTPAKATAAPVTFDTTNWNKVGRNISFMTQNGQLFIAVPVTAEVVAASPISKSGKSKSIGSTEGNVAIPGLAAKFGLNVYQPV